MKKENFTEVLVGNCNRDNAHGGTLIFSVLIKLEPQDPHIGSVKSYCQPPEILEKFGSITYLVGTREYDNNKTPYALCTNKLCRYNENYSS